jgi:hypothetical protein
MQIQINTDSNIEGREELATEFRMQGHPPIEVTDQAATVGQAVHGAASKLKKAIESDLGRLRDHQRPRTDA